MKRYLKRWPALGAAVWLQLAAGAIAAETNTPTAPPKAPLAALTVRLLQHSERVQLPPKLPRVLDLNGPAETNQTFYVPEIERLDSAGFYNWIAAVQFNQRPQLLIAHSEVIKEGLALTVYLTSASGVLEKVARRVNGGEFSRLPLKEAGADFQKQVAFWQAWLEQQPRAFSKIL